MGLQAVYLAVDESTLDDLVALPPAELGAALERLEESGAPTLHLDKMWDGLHFLLTGASAGTPIEDDPLSEAVVGTHVFDGEDYTGCTELFELPPVIEALAAFPLADRLAAADFQAFWRAEIYPNAWGGSPAALRAELGCAFTDLLAFHRTCLAQERHLVVSIL